MVAKLAPVLPRTRPALDRDGLPEHIVSVIENALANAQRHRAGKPAVSNAVRHCEEDVQAFIRDDAVIIAAAIRVAMREAK